MGAPRAACPRCPADLTFSEERWLCPEHGDVAPLWRATESSYGGFVAHLQAAGAHPTYLPWPLGPGWTVSDHGRVGRDGEDALATLTCCTGASALDGPVDVLIVSEEPGVGLGARCAGLGEHAPGPELGEGRPAARVRLEHQVVPLWTLSTASASAQTDLDRSVLVGEAAGRWLWLLLRPASAILLLREDWILRDASQLGPTLVELGFGGPRPPW